MVFVTEKEIQLLRQMKSCSDLVVREICKKGMKKIPKNVNCKVVTLITKNFVDYKNCCILLTNKRINNYF
jgi:hypothetical protein